MGSPRSSQDELVTISAGWVSRRGVHACGSGMDVRRISLRRLSSAAVRVTRFFIYLSIYLASFCK